MPTVSLPDGQEVVFPDDLDQPTIKAAIYKRFPQFAPQPKVPPPSQPGGKEWPVIPPPSVQARPLAGFAPDAGIDLRTPATNLAAAQERPATGVEVGQTASPIQRYREWEATPEAQAQEAELNRPLVNLPIDVYKAPLTELINPAAAEGLARGVKKQAEAMTSKAGLATLPWMAVGGVEGAALKGAGMAGRAVTAAFGIEGAAGLADSAKEYVDAVRAGDAERAGEAWVSMAGNAMMVMGGVAGVREMARPIPKGSPIEPAMEGQVPPILPQSERIVLAMEKSRARRMPEFTDSTYEDAALRVDPSIIPVERQLPAPRRRMPEFAETTLEPEGPPPKALPAPGETMRPNIRETTAEYLSGKKGNTLVVEGMSEPINLPESPLGPRTEGYRIKLPVEPEAAKATRDRWAKPIDIEVQVEGADALRELVKITDEQKTPGKPYEPPSVNVDLRQLERKLRENTVSTWEDYADRVIQDRLRNASSNPFLDPELLAAAMIKGAILFKRGIIKAAEWNEKMREQFGRGIEEHLPRIYNQSKEYWETRAKEASGNAIENKEAATLHGDVLRDAEKGNESAKSVPTNEGGARVRTQSKVAENKPSQVASETAPQAAAPVEPVVSQAGGSAVPAAETAPAISKATTETGKMQLPGRDLAAKVAQGAADRLNELRDTVRTLLKTRSPREVATFTRDRVENAANLFARTETSNITGSLRRAFGKENLDIADEALSFAVESGVTQEGLDSMRAKLAESAEADPKIRERALQAIDFAKRNLESLRPIVDEFNRITDNQLSQENAAGYDVLKRNNYVPHLQDIETEGGWLSGNSGSGEATGFKKVRTHATFADSISAGIDPKTLGASKLLEHRLANGQRMINRGAWIESLKDIDSGDGTPFLRDPEIITRANGTTYPQAPDGYTLKYIWGKPVAVRQGLEGILDALTDPSWFSKTAPLRVFRNITQGGKSFSLMFDTFHLGRISFWDALIKSLGVKTFELPVPEWMKGKQGQRSATILNTSVRELHRMADAGEIPREWVDDLVQAKREVGLAVDSGFNIGRVTDNLHTELVDAIPMVGTFKKWLFDEYQRSAMMEAWRLEFKRRRMARPSEPEAESARYVSNALNIRFGNLGRQGIFKSASANDLARLLFLAPQWNEGLIRSELGAGVELAQFVKDTAKGEKVYGGVLMRSVGGMIAAQFVANQIINMATRGHPTWENPEEGVGAKVSAFIPDFIGGGPGFFLHPLGLAAETTHLLTKAYERSGDFAETMMSYLRSRVSTSMRPVLTFITKSDFLGRTLKPETLWWQIAKDAVPAPIGGSALAQAGASLAGRERREAFVGQFQKQAMSTFGVKTDQAPSPEGRIQALAKEFNERNNVPRNPQFFVGDFSKLASALRAGNRAAAADALQELREKKTDKAILNHFKTWPNHPFTGNKTRESQFRDTLSKEQETQYEKAREARREIRDSVRELLDKMPRAEE